MVMADTEKHVGSFFGKLIFLSLLLTGLWITPAQAEDPLDESSPLYTEYNTFIDASNFLELISVGSDQVNAKISFFKIDGTFQKAIRVYIDPQTQVDLDVNTLVGVKNTYGVVKIEFNNNNPNARLQGRMSVYRVEDSGADFSFAYALPLRTALTGATSVTSNTYDPQGRGFVVPNWLSITNLSAATETFVYSIYDQAGVLLSSQALTLAANERRDLAGSFGNGEAVFLNEIVPNNPAAEYLAGVTRYASNTKPGGAFNSYLYAMPVFARPGTGVTQYMPIFNRSADCWQQTNWVEVLNVSSSSATVTLNFRRKDGNLINSTNATLAPRGQFHFNASAILDLADQEIGSVSVATDTPSSAVSQSVVYYHDCKTDALQAAYNIAGNTASEAPLAGSFNRFIDIENELVTFGTAGLTRPVQLTLREGGEQIHSSSSDLGSLATDLKFLNAPEFGTVADTYGLIGLDSDLPYLFMSYNLRVRKTGDGKKVVDFVVPIPVR
jgi:hypothetical protein